MLLRVRPGRSQRTGPSAASAAARNARGVIEDMEFALRKRCESTAETSGVAKAFEYTWPFGFSQRRPPDSFPWLRVRMPGEPRIISYYNNEIGREVIQYPPGRGNPDLN